MATLLNVVVNKKAFAPDTTPEEMHDHLINEALFSFYPGKFDYFSYWDASSAANVIDGATHPGILINECTGWEKVYAEALSKSIRQLIAKAAHQGKLLEDYLPQAFGLWDVAKYAKALNGCFEYQEEIYMDEEANFHVLIPEDDKTEIQEHPGNFVIIPVYYH